jgi:hypothetical protein
MSAVRALFIGLIGTMFIGLVFLGFISFMNSQNTNAEDNRTCTEAFDLQGTYIDSYVNTPDESNYRFVQAVFAQQLNALSDRKISNDLNNALVTDTVEIYNSEKFLPVMQATRDFCNERFPLSIY